MIKDNISRLRQCLPVGVILIAVTKNRSPEEIKEAISCGISDIGENKVQEAAEKYRQLSAVSFQPSGVKWHLVGHLQTNKAKDAVKIFDLIHSVDSLHLALEIDKQAKKINKVQEILLEVNTSGEVAKFGFKPKDTTIAVKEISQFKNIKLLGLMTIAPVVDNPENTRSYFRQLKELMDKINILHITHYTLHILSMGMSDDFEVAIEEGANMVRIGRVIFENA